MGCIETRRATLLKKRNGPITVKLIPTSLGRSSTAYLTITNEANGMTDTSSDTYATVNHTRSSTNTYYLNVGGFNFDLVPANAVVSEFTIRLKASMTGLSTATAPSLRYDAAITGNASSSITTTPQIITFSGVTRTFDSLRPDARGTTFYIRCPLKRASSGTAGSIYFYGAEIEVTYTLP